MNKQILQRIFIIIITTYTFLTYSLRLSFQFYGSQSIEKYESYIYSLNNGRVLDGILIQIIGLNFCRIIITPICEEYIYRFWLTKKFDYKKLLFLIIFSVFIFSQVLIFNPLGNAITYFYYLIRVNVHF